MYSLEHIKYIKRIKKEKRIISILQISIFIFFIMIWQILADEEIINTFIFSSPKKVLNIIIDLYRNNQLFSNILITIYETLFSFIVASLLGILIASIMWWNKNLYKVFEPYLTILNSLPKVALGPIIIIWFGASMKSIIVMALLISLIITIINIYDGFSNTNQNKLRLMHSLHATKFQIFFKLVLPNSLSNIMSTLKINISFSLIGVIMGEFLVSKKGIGYLILYGSQVFNLGLVISGIIILCFVATIMFYIVDKIEKNILKKDI